MICTDKKTGFSCFLKQEDICTPGYSAVKAAIRQVSQPVILLKNINGEMCAAKCSMPVGGQEPGQYSKEYSFCAYVPPLHPENFGDLFFKKAYNLKYAYIMGAMANGITSVEMVENAAHAGMLGIFGSGGLDLDSIEDAVIRLKKNLKNLPFGFNLIHSPNNIELESKTVDLYLKHEVRLISASAYMGLTLPLVRFRVSGIYKDSSGKIVAPNRIIAKVSRVEVAKKFLSPPPEKFLDQLVHNNMITGQEALLALSVPMAEDLTAEADSGGHTDNQAAISLLPTMLSLRDEVVEKFKYSMPICVGLGGGIATPHSTAAAFAMGAAYVLTGSINQSCVEAGTSETVRQMLSETKQADVVMAPAADMFEMGVKVQVLKRGTMFSMRSSKLYDFYSQYDCFENIPLKQKKILERDFFRRSFEEEWNETKNYFSMHDPKVINRAEKDDKYKMALVFRAYLWRSSHWAITGDLSRKIDYQIWCGPSMGAFNEWVKGTFLEKYENRKVVVVAMNLLAGASVVTRANCLKNQIDVFSGDMGKFAPLRLKEINKLLGF